MEGSAQKFGGKMRSNGNEKWGSETGKMAERTKKCGGLKKGRIGKKGSLKVGMESEVGDC
jgi:hypothetical protein